MMADKPAHVQSGYPSDRPTDPFSLEQVLEYFVNISYPASRQELIAHAQQQNAPQETLHLIERFPERQYNAPQDIMKAVNQVN